MPLPHLGIVQPVRVCDTCYDERGAAKVKATTAVASSSATNGTSSNRSMQPRSARVDDENDRDFIMALQMSLEESKRKPELPKAPPTVAPAATAEEEDEDLKAAIAASLKDMEASKSKINYGSVQPTSYSSEPVSADPVAGQPVAVESASSAAVDGYPNQHVSHFKRIADR